MEILHKSACITCKRAIAEIERMNEDIKKRDFFKEPLTESELKKIIKMTGKRPAEMLRKRDKAFKEMSLGDGKKTDAELIKLMVRHPGLIMRPIIISGNKAFVGKIDAMGPA